MSRKSRRLQSAPAASPTPIEHRDHVHFDVRELQRCEERDLHETIEAFYASMDEMWDERVPEPIVLQYAS